MLSYLMSGSDPAPQRLGFSGAEGMVNHMCPVGARTVGGIPQMDRCTFPRKSW